MVLAELSCRDLVPAIWLPTPGVRADRERARWRLHLVRHRTALKNRIHATPMAFGHPCPVSDRQQAQGQPFPVDVRRPGPVLQVQSDGDEGDVVVGIVGEHADQQLVAKIVEVATGEEEELWR